MNYTKTHIIILAIFSHHLGNKFDIIHAMEPRTHKTFSVMAAFDLSSMAGQHRLSGLYRFLSENHDWNLILLRSADQLTAGRIKEAARQKVDGFLIATLSNDKIRTLLRRIEVPTVFTDYPDKALERDFARCVFVFDDNSSLANAAVRHFLTQGKCRSYGYAEADNIHPWNIVRGERFVAGMAAHGMNVDVFKHTDTRPADEVAAWLSGLPRPAGVLASFDDVARVLLEACRMAKLKVPEDVAVLGIGNDPMICEHTVPQLSSVVPRFKDLGYRAARELQAMMISRRLPQRREIAFGAKGIEERRSTNRTLHGGALVQRGLAYIAENVLAGITVADVVRHLNVSWRLADLRFREVTGATIQVALVNARLERVKRWLKETDMRVSDIAQRCGCVPGALRNLFHRHCGVSMLKYRAAAKKRTSSKR